ncbi:MAG: hypothetical protein ACK5HS_05250 [Mycoplasmatales bacterium]
MLIYYKLIVNVAQSVTDDFGKDDSESVILLETGSFNTMLLLASVIFSVILITINFRYNK